MAKKKQETPKEETKAQRFRRVMESRVSKALKAIRLVGSVRGSSYEYDEKQLAQVDMALQSAVEKCMASLIGEEDARDTISLK